MKKNSRLLVVRKVILWVFSVIFLGVAFYLIFHTKTYILLKQLDPFFIIVLAGISFIYILENVLATQVLLRGMGYAVSYNSLYWILTTSAFANESSPGPIGVPVRLFLFKRILGIPLSTSTANTTVESGVGILTSGVIAAIGFVHLFQSMILEFGSFLLLTFGAIILALAVFYTISNVKFQKSLLLSKYIHRVIDFVYRIKLGIETVKPLTLLAFWMLLVVRIVIRVLVTYEVLIYFGHDLPPLVILYIQSITGLISIASMIPVGLGVKDISMLAFFSQVGIPGDLATLVVLSERMMWTVIPFFVGLVSANRLGMKWLDINTISPNTQAMQTKYGESQHDD
jgi:uncharacterized protein (TIRG00374 family)